MPNKIKPSLYLAFTASMFCCCSDHVDSLFKNALHNILLLQFLMDVMSFLHYEQWKQLPITVLSTH